MLLFLDLNVYTDFLANVQEEIKNIHSIIEQAKQHYTADRAQNIDSLIRTLTDTQDYLRNLNDTQARIVNSYSDLSSITRPTRSILNLGGVFKFLFGTADDSDVQEIKHGLRAVQSSQKQVLHILEHNLSILNVTRSDVSQNRHSINELISSLHTVQSEIRAITNRIDFQIQQVMSFHEIVNALHLTTGEIRRLLASAEIYLEELTIKLNMLSLQQLTPALLTPSHLRDLLHEIEPKLPKSFALPLDPKSQLWQFYTSLHCSTIMSVNRLGIIIDIPLKPISESFRLVRATPLPVAYLNDTSKIKVSANIEHFTASIDVDAQYFLINTDFSQYALLSSREANTCLEESLPFCEINNGIESTYITKSCAIVSYLKRQGDADKFCKTLIHTAITLPRAISVNVNSWLILSNVESQFSIKCQNGSSSVITVTPPMFELQMHSECKAISKSLFLPQYFVGTLTSDISHFEASPIELRSLNFSQIWQPFHNTFINSTAVVIPKKLKDVRNVPIDDFINEIQTIDQGIMPLQEPSSTISVLNIIIISAIVLIVLVIFIFVLKRKLGIKLCAGPIGGKRGVSKGRDGPAPPVAYSPGTSDVVIQTMVPDEADLPLLGKSSAPPESAPPLFNKADVSRGQPLALVPRTDTPPGYALVSVAAAETPPQYTGTSIRSLYPAAFGR